MSDLERYHADRRKRFRLAVLFFVVAMHVVAIAIYYFARFLAAN
jgi:hypothetical protein